MEKMLRKNMLSPFIVSSGLGSVDNMDTHFSVPVKDRAALRTIRAGRSWLVTCLWSCWIQPRAKSLPLHNTSYGKDWGIRGFDSHLTT